MGTKKWFGRSQWGNTFSGTLSFLWFSSCHTGMNTWPKKFKIFFGKKNFFRSCFFVMWTNFCKFCNSRKKTSLVGYFVKWTNKMYLVQTLQLFVTSFETEECLNRDVPEAKRWKNGSTLFEMFLKTFLSNLTILPKKSYRIKVNVWHVGNFKGST